MIEAPKVEEAVIVWDGSLLYTTCIDQRSFALHKLWLSKQLSRQGTRRPRDVAQAHTVAAVTTAYMRRRFNDPALSRLPSELKAGVPELVRAAKELD